MSTWKKSFQALDIPPCSPPRWMRGGHRQTLLGNFTPSIKVLPPCKAVPIALPDGDRLVGCRYTAPEAVALLYLFHGLGGSTESGYMRRMIRVGLANGFHVLAVNHRGCGAGRGLAAQPYHSGRAEDLSAAIAYGRDLYPDLQHVAVGFSLSGNALLLLQAGFRGDTRPDLGIAVNPPIDLEHGAIALHQGFNRVYDFRFALKCQAAARQRYRDGLIQTRYRFPFFQTLHDFDNSYTAPEGRFQDREDYYRTCSSKPYLSRITAPTVLLTSEDDPIVAFETYRDVHFSPHVLFHPERFGGHLGYLMPSDSLFGVRRWLDETIETYLRTWLSVACPNQIS